MKSTEMLDVLQKAFKEMDFFHGRPAPNVVTFFQSISGRTFKGQAFAKADEFIRVELWLNLFGEDTNYEGIREGIKLADGLLKNAGGADQWMVYGVNEKKHYLAVFLDITADQGKISIEQCKECYQKMVAHTMNHLTMILL